MTDPDRARARAEVVRLLRAEPWRSVRELVRASGGALDWHAVVAVLSDLDAAGLLRSRLSPPPEPPRRYALAGAADWAG